MAERCRECLINGWLVTLQLCEAPLAPDNARLYDYKGCILTSMHVLRLIGERVNVC